MNISGILVIVPPAHVNVTIAALDCLGGIDVHQSEPETGRIIITQEAETIQSEVEGLKRIKALPHVILAEMVYHCFEEDKELVEGIPPELDELEGMNQVPPFLNS